MTATEYEGKQVVAAEPALSPITTNAGESVFFRQIHKLLLDDGTEVFGCIHCDYVRPQIGSIRPHLKKHTPKKLVEGKSNDPAGDAYYKQVVTDFRHLTLDDILGLADRWLREGPEIESGHQAVLDNLREDRDNWKARAREAEKKLAAGQKALQVMLGQN